MHNFFLAIKKSIYYFFKEDYFFRASALAFTTILALVPLFVVIVFFITLFPIFNKLIALAETYFVHNFIPSMSATLESHFSTFIQQAQTMPIGSIIFLLITAIMLVNTVEETFNILWRVEKRRRKIQAIIVYSLIIFLTPIIMGLSIFITSTLLNYYWIMRITELFQLKLFIDFIMPILLNSLLFSMMYVIVPSIRVKWRYGITGGFLAAIVFNFTRIGFVWYLEKFQSYSVIYGVFAVIPVFMIWLYVAWIIIMWGALFTYYLQTIMLKAKTR